MIKPLGTRVVLKVHRITETAMMMVDPKDAELEKATVISVGEECTLVKENDIIFFKDYDTSKILEDNESLVIIKEEDILCIYIPTK